MRLYRRGESGMGKEWVGVKGGGVSYKRDEAEALSSGYGAVDTPIQYTFKQGHQYEVKRGGSRGVIIYGI